MKFSYILLILMVVMHLEFKDTNGNTLGDVSHTGFLDVLIPAYRDSGYSFYLKHSFSSASGVKEWRIADMVFASNRVTITLEPSDSHTSLKAFTLKQNKKISDFIKPYQIAEVDFGHFYDSFDNAGNISSNLENCGTLLPGELHKRRPCIVYVVEKDSVQVIPLSASEQEMLVDSEHVVPISPDSFKNMASRYAEKPSFALIGMVQTVSAFRVFPPRNTVNRHEHKYVNYEITASDREALRLALARRYSKGLAADYSALNQRFEKLAVEKSAILEANNRIKADLKTSSLKSEQLEDFIIKIGRFFDLGNSAEEIMRKFENNNS